MRESKNPSKPNKKPARKFSVTDWKRRYARATPKEKAKMKSELIVSTFNDIYEHHQRMKNHSIDP